MRCIYCGLGESEGKLKFSNIGYTHEDCEQRVKNIGKWMDGAKAKDFATWYVNNQ